jgi:hypothetical protein
MNIPIQQPKTCTCVTHNRGAAAQRITNLETDKAIDAQDLRHHIRERDKAKAKLIVYAHAEEDLHFKNLLMRLIIEERVVARYTQTEMDRQQEISALRALHAL